MRPRLTSLEERAVPAEFGGVEFPQGAASFADEVLFYRPVGDIDSAYITPTQSLGAPNYPAPDITTGEVTLGQGGELALAFTNNVLTNGATDAEDLWIFEVGPDEFHPPYEQVVAEYLGQTEAAQGVTPENASELTTDAADDCAGTHQAHTEVGGGNRAAFLEAFENAVDAGTHSLVEGLAPAGAVLTLQRTGVFPLWDGSQVADTLDELTRAVRIWRTLGEEIDRQPNVLLLGRGTSNK